MEDKLTILYIDSGCDINHPEISKNLNLKDSKSFVSEDSTLIDYTGHGTQVISCITGNKNIVGLYKNSEVVIYKITDCNGNTKFDYLFKAIEEAIYNDYKYINISYTGYTTDDELIKKFQNLIDIAVQKDIFIFASVNNNGIENKFSIPNDLNGVYSVGSVNIHNEISEFSKNKKYYFLAPGGDYYGKRLDEKSYILLANPRNFTDPIASIFGIDKGYALSFGNSIACSYCTCCMAVFIENLRKNNNKEDVRNIIEREFKNKNVLKVMEGMFFCGIIQ